MRCQTQQYRSGHNHTQNFVMVLITLETILNEKVQAIIFARWSYFGYEKKWFHIRNKNYGIRFLSALANPKKNDPARPPGWKLLLYTVRMMCCSSQQKQLYCNAGPSPGFSSREMQKPERGPHFKNTILDLYSNRGATDFKWGVRAPLLLTLATDLL